MTSSSVRKIDNRLDQLETGSLRHQVMTALRRFRASWVELGNLLNQVANGGDYKEWGYDDFEVYCASELGLKKPTVQKLMNSYRYMQKYESRRLHDFEDNADQNTARSIPDFQTVELLDRIRRTENAPEQTFEELHRKVFDGGDEEPALRKELRQYLRPPLTESAIQEGADLRKRELGGILRIARDLRRRLATSQAVPGGLKERIERCLVELEALD